jgi:peptide-methionine (S)-S-oxide reductase
MAAFSFFSSGGDDAHAAETGVLPKPELELASDKDAKPGEVRTMVVASGCFWCTEAVFEELEGVGDVISGYAGGTKETANYEAVCTGRTGHAEAVEVIYDPARLRYADLLGVFFENHDPTTSNRQGPDVGEQYRSAIFVHSPEQEREARAKVAELDAAERFRRPIVTQIVPAAPFWRAEEYHQRYFEKKGIAPTCHLPAPPH